MTARWVTAWMVAGMPVGYWSMPFAVEGLEGLEGTTEPERVTPEETLDAIAAGGNDAETVAEALTDEEEPV